MGGDIMGGDIRPVPAGVNARAARRVASPERRFRPVHAWPAKWHSRTLIRHPVSRAKTGWAGIFARRQSNLHMGITMGKTAKMSKPPKTADLFANLAEPRRGTGRRAGGAAA